MLRRFEVSARSHLSHLHLILWRVVPLLTSDTHCLSVRYIACLSVCRSVRSSHAVPEQTEN